MLQRALADLKMRPEREGQEVAHSPLVNEGTPDLLIDGTERGRQRPNDATRQKAHYSGKKRAHTDKNLVLVHEQTGKGIYLSPTVEGKKHDKKAADQTGDLGLGHGNCLWFTQSPPLYPAPVACVRFAKLR